MRYANVWYLPSSETSMQHQKSTRQLNFAWPMAYFGGIFCPDCLIKLSYFVGGGRGVKSDHCSKFSNFLTGFPLKPWYFSGFSLPIIYCDDHSSISPLQYNMNFIHISLSYLLTTNRPFATSDHVVQNPPCWRASSLFPHWDIKTKASQASLVQVSLF